VVRARSGIELVYVPPGSFVMGSDSGDENDKPAHRVTIGKGFYMGKYEVMQAQWQAVMGANPSYFKGDNLPVEKVSWDGAQKFIQKLNSMSDDFIYRLPSEAEWEYACRAGTTTEFAFVSSEVEFDSTVSKLSLQSPPRWLSSKQANFSDDLYPWRAQKGRARGKTTPVGNFQANAFGLYDMHGNVSEWCQDYYYESYNGAPTDGSAWLSGKKSKFRVLRGGGWYSPVYDLRTANHNGYFPERHSDGVGLRVVAVARQ
jgi:formylglycine-generating enzyme required for sulfatase activity